MSLSKFDTCNLILNSKTKRMFGSYFGHFRLTVTASCPMKLQYFPMDTQNCQIEIESCEFFLIPFNQLVDSFEL